MNARGLQMRRESLYVESMLQALHSPCTAVHWAWLAWPDMRVRFGRLAELRADGRRDELMDVELTVPHRVWLWYPSALIRATYEIMHMSKPIIICNPHCNTTELLPESFMCF